MEETGVLARLQLGLGHSGLERHVPKARRFRLICLAASEVTQETSLGNALCMLTNGLVVVLPVNRKAEPAPQLFKALLVLGRQLQAQLNKVLPRDRYLVAVLHRLRITLKWRLKVWLVGQ